MPSILKFTPLSGALSDTPLCYLLDWDGFRILLDCGWNDAFDPEVLAPLQRVARSVNAVLLSHPDVAHLGALPYAHAMLGLNCPVYATLPVYNLGQLTMYDACLSRRQRQEFNLFGLDDIDSAFAMNRWVLLNYAQQYTLPPLAGKPAGITITAFPAGHLMGGTCWLISRETDVVVYAVNYNHSKERLLAGTTLSTIERPSLLITDAGSLHLTAGPAEPRRDELFEAILSTVKVGGNALLPTDSAGRVLELILLLEQYWTHNRGNVRRLGGELVLLTNVSYNTINYTQTMTEWMSGSASAAGAARESPFLLKHFRLCHDFAELEQVRGPKIVLTSTESLAPSYALDLFVQWAADARNTIIFTRRPPPGSLAHQILSGPRQSQLVVKVPRRVPLEGAELAEHWRREQRKKTAAAAAAAAQRREAAREAVESEDSDDEDAGADGMDVVDAKPSAAANGTGHGSVGFFKHTRSYPMFSVVEPHRRFDDYGEEINPNDFVDASADAMALAVPAAPVDLPVPHPLLLRPGVDAAAAAAPPPPSKAVVQEVTVALACRLLMIELEGLADAKSVKAILERVAPRKLILVGGTEADTRGMKELLERGAEHPPEILTPRVKQVVDVSSTSNILQVKMTEGLFQALHPIEKGDYELAYLRGQLVHNPEDDSHVLDVAPPPPRPIGQPDHPDLFIGEVMLSQFKGILQRKGFQAEFTSGLLVCNGEVAIRKTETGKLTLEGVLSETYYQVRSLLYQQYAIL